MQYKGLDTPSWLTVRNMMNTNFKALHITDNLGTVLRCFREYNLNVLPVVDDQNALIGVFSSKRLYRALTEGLTLDDPCAPYVVYDPVTIPDDTRYDEVSFALRVLRSKVADVMVVNSAGQVVGIIGSKQYLREGMEAFLASYMLLEVLFNIKYEAAILVDKKGRIIKMNSAAEGMFNLQFSEIKGLLLQDVLPGIYIMNKRHLGARNIVKSIPVIVNQMPIIDDEGIIAGTMLTLLDISDVEEIAAELEVVKDMQVTLESVLNATADGILVTDNKGKVKYANQRAGSLLSRSPLEMIGEKGQDILGSSINQVLDSGLPEIKDHSFNGKKGVISHMPIKQEKDGIMTTIGAVSRIYSEGSAFTEEIASRLLSLNKQVNYYRNELERRGNEGGFKLIVTKNMGFAQIKEEARRIARSSSTVLLTGESGVGKDMFARAIHSSSPRSKHPFIKVNCAAIPETLLESELFGYAPGSFTGALKNGKAGLFEQANKGTIFLDEIGDMPLSIQVKILQVLQDRQFTRVGGVTAQTVDVRIIAATNKDLREAIANGQFREDLFYRLNVIELHLPPLRERLEDIIPLSLNFIEKYNQILGANVTGISDEAQNVLKRYSWPGNIRELENAIERASNYAWNGHIDVEHLPTHLLNHTPNNVETSSYRSVLSNVDREIVLEALIKTKGNKSAAARMLNLSRSAFYDRLKKYGIT